MSRQGPSTDIDVLIERAAHTAREHGFIETDVPAKLLLIVSEICEAMEEYRNHRALSEIYYVEDGDPRKPEGIPIELADAVIRIFSFCGQNGIDLTSAILQKMSYNETRPYKHGGKRV